MLIGCVASLPESVCAPQNNITVPLLMPSVTLMERQIVIFDGMDLWENTDQSCEIMLKHLATARFIAQNADMYRMTAERILEGRDTGRSKILLHVSPVQYFSE